MAPIALRTAPCHDLGAERVDVVCGAVMTGIIGFFVGSAKILDTLVMELPHFVMDRKMLLGIKRRAENGRT